MVQQHGQRWYLLRSSSHGQSNSHLADPELAMMVYSTTQLQVLGLKSTVMISFGVHIILFLSSSAAAFPFPFIIAALQIPL